MYCKYCGKKIDNDSIFCSYCGKNISSKIAKNNDFENSDYEPVRTVKNGIIYEDGYSVGKVPSYCDPNADEITQY